MVHIYTYIRRFDFYYKSSPASGRRISERKFGKFEGKNLEIHGHSWLSTIWIFKKLNSIQTLVKDIQEIKLSHCSLLSKTYKKTHSITRILITLNKFVFYPKNCLVPLWILSFWESTVAAPISLLARYI